MKLKFDDNLRLHFFLSYLLQIYLFQRENCLCLSFLYEMYWTKSSSSDFPDNPKTRKRPFFRNALSTFDYLWVFVIVNSFVFVLFITFWLIKLLYLRTLFLCLIADIITFIWYVKLVNILRRSRKIILIFIVINITVNDIFACCFFSIAYDTIYLLQRASLASIIALAL